MITHWQFGGLSRTWFCLVTYCQTPGYQRPFAHVRLRDYLDRAQFDKLAPK